MLIIFAEKCQVGVVEAKQLLGKDKDTGLSDPFVTVQIGKQVRITIYSCAYPKRSSFIVQQRKTSVVKKNLSPVFGSVFDFTPVESLDEVLSVTVLDHDVLTDDTIGQVTHH
jgi:Ca2+-dependent lipid-binding protein